MSTTSDSDPPPPFSALLTALRPLRDLLPSLTAGDMLLLPLVRSELSLAAGAGSTRGPSSFEDEVVTGASSAVGPVKVLKRDILLRHRGQHECCVLFHEISSDPAIAILYVLPCTSMPGDTSVLFGSGTVHDYFVPCPSDPPFQPKDPVHALEGKIFFQTRIPGRFTSKYSYPRPLWMEATVAAQAYPLDLPVARQTPLRAINEGSLGIALCLAAEIDPANEMRKYADQAAFPWDQRNIPSDPAAALEYRVAKKQAHRDKDVAFLATYDHFREGAYVTTYIGDFAAKYWCPRTEEEELLGDNDLNWGSEEEEDDEEAEMRDIGDDSGAGGDKTSSVAGWLADVSLGEGE